jgi:hypothetical protein
VDNIIFLCSIYCSCQQQRSNRYCNMMVVVLDDEGVRRCAVSMKPMIAQSRKGDDDEVVQGFSFIRRLTHVTTSNNDDAISSVRPTTDKGFQILSQG